MAGNPGNPTRRMMYEAAFMNLSNGIVSPVDKDILAYAPLPDSVTDSYTTREVDPLQTMNLANNALTLWVDEAKKASYFTAHFVTLSRMIMNGVATMARGLVTLHIQGEDLDRAPLSIQDLIGISSYQFRKSYLPLDGYPDQAFQNKREACRKGINASGIRTSKAGHKGTYC